MKLGYFCSYFYQKYFSAYLLVSGIFPQATPLNILVLAQCAERHCAERHCAERHCAERTLCRKTLCRKDIVPKVVSYDFLLINITMGIRKVQYQAKT